jgi:hypothetical protein
MRFDYSRSLLMERAEMLLSDRILIEVAMETQRIQRQDPYDLRFIVPLLKKTAKEHAGNLIWC